MVVKPKSWEIIHTQAACHIKDLRPTELGATIGNSNKQSTQTNEVNNALQSNQKEHLGLS